MSDMTIRGVQKEATPSEKAARQPNRAGASFAELLRQTSAQPTSSAAEVEQAGGEITTEQILTGQQAALCIQAASQVGRLPGESAEQWQRRCISYETARLWQTSSRQWQAESADMDFVDGVIYQSGKASQWAAALMEKKPAMFREWLEQEKWHIEESGVDTAILPDGFTGEDMGRWMEKDVLDYL